MASEKMIPGTSGADFTEKLFGDITELSDEELDLLFDATAPSESASVSMYRLAEQSAVEYRRAGKVPPDHVQAILRATRPQTSLEGAKAPFLKNIVETLKAPFSGPVSNPAFSYRDRTDITDSDKAGIDELSDELSEDWEDEEK
jgi:hypothetical protein